MGCTRCGTDARLIELLLNKFIQDNLKDGTLQAGLKDCFNQRLEKNTNVITCHSLEDAICQLQTDGRLCFLTPTALHHDAKKGVLSIIMSDGTTLDTPLDVKSKDTYIASGSFDAVAGKIVLTYNDTSKPNIELDVSTLKKGLTVVKNADGSLVFTRPDGTTVSMDAPTPAPVFGDSLTTRKGKIEVNENILPKFGTTIQPVNGKLEVAHDETLFVKPDGKLSVRNKDCVEVNNLDVLEGTPLGKLGMTCFYKAINARAGEEVVLVGMPANPIATTPTQPPLRSAADYTADFRAYDASVASTADVTGWQVASGTEIAQVVIVDGHAWSRTNRGGMYEGGRLADNRAWSLWRKLDNIPTPPVANATRDVVFKNSSGKVTLGYGYSTEQ